MSKARVLFMGTPDFAVPSLRLLLEEKDQVEVIGVVTQPDRPKGRKKVLTPPPVKVEAIKHDLPVFQPQKLRSEEVGDAIIELEGNKFWEDCLAVRELKLKENAQVNNI